MTNYRYPPPTPERLTRPTPPTRPARPSYCDGCGRLTIDLHFAWHDWPAPPRWLCRQCERRAVAAGGDPRVEGRGMRQAGRMSVVQRDILEWLLAWTQHIETHGSDLAKHGLAAWGVPWRSKNLYRDLTRSVAAAVSRALKRLERRGFVERWNDQGAGGNEFVSKLVDIAPNRRKSTRVKLTEAGREVAEQLHRRCSDG